MVVRTDAAKENPVAVKAALTALSEDGEWLNQHTNAASDFLVKELLLLSKKLLIPFFKRV